MEETNSLARSRRMGEMPEGKLLLSMAVPMMLSMLVQALYNIVDSVYVAKVSEDCLSALSLAFPAQNILIGLATGTGVGVSTMLSRALGSRDNKLANRVAGNSLFLCVCCWIIMAIFGIFFGRRLHPLADGYRVHPQLRRFVSAHRYDRLRIRVF